MTSSSLLDYVSFSVGPLNPTGIGYSPPIELYHNEIVLFNTGNVLTEFERDVVAKLIECQLPTTPHHILKSLPYLKWLHKEVFDHQYRKELSLVGRLTLIRRVIHACIVRQVIVNEKRPLPSLEHLHMMPLFSDPDICPSSDDEILSLRRFMRAIQTLHDIGLPGANNKITFIDVAAMLDGSNRPYSFGGAPSKATIRRAIVFHHVTGTPSSDENIWRVKRKRSATDDDIHPLGYY